MRRDSRCAALPRLVLFSNLGGMRSPPTGGCFPRDESLADLQKWDAAEARYPETFLGMYQVWCQKPANGAAG